jgi:hypothetical protein
MLEDLTNYLPVDSDGSELSRVCDRVNSLFHAHQARHKCGFQRRGDSIEWESVPCIVGDALVNTWHSLWVGLCLGALFDGIRACGDAP